MNPDPNDDDLDPVWRALANPVRRGILDELKRAPRQTGDLADAFEDLSRFAIMQHLGVLEEADLVVRRRTGRVTMNYFNPVPIQRIADRWIDRMRRPWVESLVELKAELEEGGDEETDQDESAADRAG
jgi:DNA-binding transcriptional ArsR family regulator